MQVDDIMIETLITSFMITMPLRVILPGLDSLFILYAISFSLRVILWL